MLAISRRMGQTIMIGDAIFLTVEKILADTGQVYICAPAGLIDRIQAGAVLERRTNAVRVSLARGERVDLGDELAIALVHIRREYLLLSITAPPEVSVRKAFGLGFDGAAATFRGRR